MLGTIEIALDEAMCIGTWLDVAVDVTVTRLGRAIATLGTDEGNLLKEVILRVAEATLDVEAFVVLLSGRRPRKERCTVLSLTIEVHEIDRKHDGLGDHRTDHRRVATGLDHQALVRAAAPELIVSSGVEAVRR